MRRELVEIATAVLPDLGGSIEPRDRLERVHAKQHGADVGVDVVAFEPALQSVHDLVLRDLAKQNEVANLACGGQKHSF